MTRVAISAYGAQFRGSPGAALARQIEREFGPIRAHTPDAARVAVCWASSKGDLHQLARGADFWAWTPDATARALARQFQIGGRCAAPNAACATGAHAIALGAQWIQDGHADLVLAGAIEPPQHPMVTAAYRNMGALSKSGVMRPFDARRDGFVPGAGGGFLVLENEGQARARGARICGFVSGWSLGCDATHMTQMAPDGETIARAIESALKRAGSLTIGYVNAHGTATVNDLVEARALHRVFGAGVAVSSTKPLTGHLLGAAGASRRCCAWRRCGKAGRRRPPIWKKPRAGSSWIWCGGRVGRCRLRRP